MGAYLLILLNFSAEFLIRYYTVSLSYNLRIYFYYRVPKDNVVHTNIYLIQFQYFEAASTFKLWHDCAQNFMRHKFRWQQAVLNCQSVR